MSGGGVEMTAYFDHDFRESQLYKLLQHTLCQLPDPSMGHTIGYWWEWGWGVGSVSPHMLNIYVRKAKQNCFVSEMKNYILC